MSLATEAVMMAEQTGEYAPVRLNHLAYVTNDTAVTVQFWTEVMQMPLVEAVMHERVPPRPEPTHPAYLVFDHPAPDVGPRREPRARKDHLPAHPHDDHAPTHHR